MLKKEKKYFLSLLRLGRNRSISRRRREPTMPRNGTG
jgi:hypothetical protein